MISIEYKTQMLEIRFMGERYDADFEDLIHSGYFTSRESNGYIYLDSIKPVFMRVFVYVPNSKEKKNLEMFLSSKYRFGNINGIFELNVVYVYTKLKKNTVKIVNSYLPESCDYVLYNMNYSLYHTTPGTRGFNSVDDIPIFNLGIDIHKYKHFYLNQYAMLQYLEFLFRYEKFNVSSIIEDFFDFIIDYYKKSYGLDLTDSEVITYLQYFLLPPHLKNENSSNPLVEKYDKVIADKLNSKGYEKDLPNIDLPEMKTLFNYGTNFGECSVVNISTVYHKIHVNDLIKTFYDRFKTKLTNIALEKIWKDI